VRFKGIYSPERKTIMNTDKTMTTPRKANEKAPTITRKIGNTTFDIHVHFSETSKETFTDKVLRLIKNDANCEATKN
jgi:hypothetical protein